MAGLYAPVSSASAWVVGGTTGVIVGVFSTYLYDELSEPKGSSFKVSLTDLVRPSSLGMILLFVASSLLFLVLLRFLARRAHRRHDARKRFDVLETASKLRPQHLGFQAIAQEEIVPQGLRPFYESVYVSRSAVPYRQRIEEDPQPTYTEAELARYLEGGDGRGFALLGPPLDGKTRTLYEIVRSMEGYKVVVPKATEQVPDEAAFSLLLEDERVVLLLDDLTQYVDAKVDLREFWERLRRHASLIVVSSTCRDGPELNAVRQTSRHGLKWFYEERIHLELSLPKASLEDKRQLIEGIGKAQEGQDLELLPHLGQIAMEGTLRHMAVRFERLSHENPEQRDALRSLKLLSAAGVLPFTQERLLAVMRDVFDRDPTHLGDCLDALAEQSFLNPGDHDPIEPEPAYLWYDVVSYPPGMRSEDYFPTLADVLEDREDTEGLFYLGATYASDFGNYEGARAYFERAVRLKPGDSQVLLDKGKALFTLGRDLSESDSPEEAADVPEEATEVCELALRAYEEAINLTRSFPEAWRGKGAALLALGNYEAAIGSFDEAIELAPDYHDAWCDKAMALVLSDRPQEALNALDEAMRTRSDCPQSWVLKGDALSMLGLGDWRPSGRLWDRPPELEMPELLSEAVEAYGKATDLRSDHFKVWMQKGQILSALERHQEALEAFDKATTLRPNDHYAWESKGQALVMLQRYEAYDEVTAKALSLDRTCPFCWISRGEAHYFAGRPWAEVAQACDKAIGLRPDHPLVWYAKANRAVDSGQHQEAVGTYDRALSLDPTLAHAWVGKGEALMFLGHYQEALEAMDQSIRLAPDDPDYHENRGTLLRRMGRYEEAREAFEKATSLRL
jgi:tetratricopeptide (TPR) repeat protein